MYFNAKNMFDKELKHRPFVFRCREKTNTLKVKTQALFFF